MKIIKLSNVYEVYSRFSSVYDNTKTLKKFSNVHIGTKTLKKFSSFLGYGCWISPNGKIYPVGHQEHENVSKDITREVCPENWEEDDYFQGDYFDDGQGHSPSSWLLSNGFVKASYDYSVCIKFFSLTGASRRAIVQILNEKGNTRRIYIKSGPNEIATEFPRDAIIWLSKLK